MKHILVIVGSCRKNGNTEQLADAFIRGAQDAGHRVEKVFLGAKKINGCLDATPAAMVSPVCKRMTGKRSSRCWKKPISSYWRLRCISGRFLPGQKRLLSGFTALPARIRIRPLAGMNAIRKKDCALLFDCCGRFFLDF